MSTDTNATQAEPGGNGGAKIAPPSANQPPYRLMDRGFGSSKFIVDANGAIVCTVPKSFAAFAKAALNAYAAAAKGDADE